MSYKCTTCKFYANSVHFLCAVNPKCEINQECFDYEPEEIDIDSINVVTETFRVQCEITVGQLKDFTFNSENATWCRYQRNTHVPVRPY
jgi:hypothetical protein